MGDNIWVTTPGTVRSITRWGNSSSRSIFLSVTLTCFFPPFFSISTEFPISKVYSSPPLFILPVWYLVYYLFRLWCALLGLISGSSSTNAYNTHTHTYPFLKFAVSCSLFLSILTLVSTCDSSFWPRRFEPRDPWLASTFLFWRVSTTYTTREPIA